ncbi:hypothetical protein ACFPO9_19475, partial [Massilia aerilata]
MQLKNICTTRSSTFTRLFIASALSSGLAACGAGSTQDNAGASAAAGAPAYAATITASTWTQCATENGTCSFTGTQQVRYGASTGYVYKTMTGPVQCTNSVFGDPAPGVGKTCAVMPVATTTPPATTATTWTQCATEGGTCSVPGTRQVRYGTTDKWAYKTVTTSVVCGNSVFGDPAPGVGKTCAYSSDTSGTTTPTTPTPAPTQPSTTVLRLPTSVANGSTVSLECGKTYQGTLEL